MKINEDTIYKTAGLAGLAMAASAFFLPLENPDLFWYFSTARHMLENGRIPRSDLLSWTMQGRDWVPVEWLAQLSFYLLYKLQGFKLLVLLKGVLLSAVAVMTWKTAALYGRAGSAWLYLPFLAAGIIHGADIRAENFSLLFFALILYRLERARVRGTVRVSAPDLAAAAVFFALWANLHAGYLYGLALIFIYFAGDMLEEALLFARGRAKAFEPGAAPAYLKLFAVSLAASFVTPYGWRIYDVLSLHYKYAGPIQKYIEEWKPFDITDLQQAPYAVMLAASFGLLIRRILITKHVNWTCLIAIMFFSVQASLHRRFIPFFMIAALPYSLSMLPVNAGRMITERSARVLQALALAALVWHYQAVIWPKYTGAASAFPAYSEGLTDFMRANKAALSKLRLYNYWSWGGFLGYALYPDYKVFIDGRYIFLDMLEDVHVPRGTEEWASDMDKKGIGLVVISLSGRQTQAKRRERDGRETVFMRPSYLAGMPENDWAVVYWDRRAVALARRGAVDPVWLKTAEYRYLRAGDYPNLLPMLADGEVSLRELEKEAARYLAGSDPSYNTSANPEVRSFMSTVKKLCSWKGARCRS